VTAVVPLLAEALNLAITEHRVELAILGTSHSMHARCRRLGDKQSAAIHEGHYSADLEALAVALHARLQEMGALG